MFTTVGVLCFKNALSVGMVLVMVVQCMFQVGVSRLLKNALSVGILLCIVVV